MSLEGKTDDEIKELEAQLLARLDERSGTAGNITLIRLLRWADDDLYWSVRDRLVDAGVLELGRGRGGSVHRVLVQTPTTVAGEVLPSPTSAISEEESATCEEDLYPLIAKVLKESWVKDNRFRQSIVEITARQGKKETGGKWSRPDITVVSMTTYLYVPGKHFDVATFEVKPSNGFDVTAVYEALAHRRAATRAYVIVHVPEGTRDATRPTLDQLCDEAKRYGVGVITIENPVDYASWDEPVEAVRIDPAPDRLSDFLSVQLSGGAKDEIVQWFK